MDAALHLSADKNVKSWRTGRDIALLTSSLLFLILVVGTLAILLMPINATASDTGMQGKSPSDFSCGYEVELISTGGAHPSGIPEYGPTDKKALASCNAQYLSWKTISIISASAATLTLLISGWLFFLRKKAIAQAM
jgi:hypothetical protein